MEKPENNRHYTFKQTDDGRLPSPERFLLCPSCGESLEQADIETFARCPFCNYRFEINDELEDFILEPIVERWIRQQEGMRPGGGMHNRNLYCELR